MLLGELAFSGFVLFAGGTFLSFTNRFGASGGAQLSEASWTLVLSFYLIGLIQVGLSGFGLPITTADVDYVFTSPVKTFEVFAAKLLQSSFTLFLTFPPIFLLYLRSALFYKTPIETALIAGLVTLVFFAIGLVLSADITLAFRSDSAQRRRKLTILKYVFAGTILAISFIPLSFMVPGAVPASDSSILSSLVNFLPSGVVAQISVGLVSGLKISFQNYVLDFGVLAVWFASVLVFGMRLSKSQFYDTLQIANPSMNAESADRVATKKSKLLASKSVWATVAAKEKIVMQRAKEGRGLFFSALILSLFLVVYALAGTFTSSPTSFLLILFIIGSFGSGNAWSWIEKERLWILKTSTISLRRYVKQVFLARVTPLLLYLTPAILAVGGVLIMANLGHLETLLRITLALSAAVEIAAISMGGSMYFASKYAQSSNDDLLTSTGQDLTNLKRTIYQTIVNLLFVAPVMLLVLSTSFVGVGSLVLLTTAVSVAALAYTVLIINTVLNFAGDSIAKREDI